MLFPAPFRPISLAKPAALAARATYPLAITFHPKLPLLYVWQDIEAVTPRAEATDAPVYKEFDHVLVYDIDRGYEFVRRIPTWNVAEGAEPENVKGIAASAKTGRLYVTTLRHIGCIDLTKDEMVWDKTPEGPKVISAYDGLILDV